MLPSQDYIVVKKSQIDDLMGAFNAALDALGRPIIKCAKCGGFHVDGYLCDCGADPEEVGSKPADLSVTPIPCYEYYSEEDKKRETKHHKEALINSIHN